MQPRERITERFGGFELDLENQTERTKANIMQAGDFGFVLSDCMSGNIILLLRVEGIEALFLVHSNFSYLWAYQGKVSLMS